MSIQVKGGQTILLGYQGENNSKEFCFDISHFKETYGANGTFLLLAKRSGDTAPYGIVTSVSGNNLIWSPSNTDTAKVGYGKCELQYYIGNALVKSEVWTTLVIAALDEGDATVPEAWESWVDNVMEAAEDIQADLSGKANKETVSNAAESNVTLSVGNTTVISGAPVSLSVTLPEPTQGYDYLCGLIFKAGSNLSFSDTAPSGCAIVWEDEPDWNENTIYEIIYRCLWLTDSNSKVIISAKYAEVNE